MDLTIPLEKITLNIRVAVMVEQAGGFVLEKNLKGFYFPVGGRVKAGETSEEAARREVSEELGFVTNDLEFRAVAELFFNDGGSLTHEICFVYFIKGSDDINLADGFGVYSIEQIEGVDFRPRVIKEIFKSDKNKILHLTSKE